MVNSAFDLVYLVYRIRFGLFIFHPHRLPSFFCDGCEQDRIYNFGKFPFHFYPKSGFTPFIADLRSGFDLNGTMRPLRRFSWCQHSSPALLAVLDVGFEHSTPKVKE